MSLQPSNHTQTNRQTTTPFLLRLYWRTSRPLEPYEFSIAPPSDTSAISDYSSLLPSSIRQQSVQIYTWPTCTLAELTGLLSSVLPEGAAGASGSNGGVGVGTRLVYKLIFPDTRSVVGDAGKGRWVDRPLGSVVVGSNYAQAGEDDNDNNNNSNDLHGSLEGDATKTLADAKFVIGDYIACTIYPPLQDGRPAPPPSTYRDSGRGPPGGREPYGAPRGPPRENGYGGSGYRGDSMRGGRGRGGGWGLDTADWRRGERVPGYEPRGGYRGGRGRPY